MIRSIDIHTGHYSPLDTDVVVLSESACVLRFHIGGATVNIFGDLNRQAEIRRSRVDEWLKEHWTTRKTPQAGTRTPFGTAS